VDIIYKSEEEFVVIIGNPQNQLLQYIPGSTLFRYENNPGKSGDLPDKNQSNSSIRRYPYKE